MYCYCSLQKCTKRQYIKKNDEKHYYYVILNHKKIHEGVNSQPTTFDDVMVFLSNEWYPAANAKVRNLKYRSNDESCLEFCFEFCTTTSTTKTTSTAKTTSTTKTISTIATSLASNVLSGKLL